MAYLPPEYFDDRRERSKIKLAIVETMPVGVRLDNIVIALAELLKRYAAQMIDYGDGGKERKGK